MKAYLLGMVLLIAGAFPAATQNSPRLLNDARLGRELAEQLRELAPTENTEFRGMLILETPRQDDREIPFKTTVTLTNHGWRTVYRAETGPGPETLSMLRKPGASTLYSLAAGGEPARIVPADEATNSFAGSDFTLMDLGLEFLDWPIQVLVTREMRKGRGCHVLESRPAVTNLYSRVVSWIDQETVANGNGVGLLMAEAYDAAGARLKQFEVRGFKRVAGRWQVKEMEIRDRQRKTSTRLQFRFDE